MGGRQAGRQRSCVRFGMERLEVGFKVYCGETLRCLTPTLGAGRGTDRSSAGVPLL